MPMVESSTNRAGGWAGVGVLAVLQGVGVNRIESHDAVRRGDVREERQRISETQNKREGQNKL